MEDCVHCECAVMGAIGGSASVTETLEGLRALQHRGQEWFGVAVFDGERIQRIRKAGLVAVSANSAELRNLTGNIVIGHNRYATAGASTLINAQPHIGLRGRLALAANGDIVPTSYQAWRQAVAVAGFAPLSDNDGELLLKIIELQLSQGLDILAAIRVVQHEVTGAFSAVVIYNNQLIAFRDQSGFRPLVFAQRADHSGWLVASEDAAFSRLGVNNIRQVQPGEIWVFNQNGSSQRHHLPSLKQHAQCSFELMYFAFPTSTIFGVPVSLAREAFGRELAQTIVADEVDMVCAVPDSSNDVAAGLAEALGRPLRFGVRRPHHQGRSFIAPTQEERAAIADTKLIVDTNIVNGQRLVLVDDSIVRGTTLKNLVAKLKRAGAVAVHVRIMAPKVIDSCFYGIATPTKDELIGANRSTEEIQAFIGADSLVYLTVDDIRRVIQSFGQAPADFCFACFNGQYPTQL